MVLEVSLVFACTIFLILPQHCTLFSYNDPSRDSERSRRSGPRPKLLQGGDNHYPMFVNVIANDEPVKEHLVNIQTQRQNVKPFVCHKLLFILTCFFF